MLLDSAQGQFVHVAMLNIIIAACTQVGDLARAFETFEVGTVSYDLLRLLVLSTMWLWIIVEMPGVPQGCL